MFILFSKHIGEGRMKLLLVADGRSPITRRWISMLQPLKLEITLVSSYPCMPIAGVAQQYVLPLAFAQLSGSQAGTASSDTKKGLVARFRPFAQRLRHLIGPWSIASKSKSFLEIIQFEKPDLVHALRLPFEGMLASYTPRGIPVILSTWGNDFTLHAAATPKMASMTSRAMRRADAMIADVHRDVRLAQEWGFDTRKPTMVVPGNGGLDLQELQAVTKGIQKADPPQIINPRGMRSYVRNDTFFKAIPLVLKKQPGIQFVCASMAGQVEALEWIQNLGIEQNVTLLPFVSQQDLWHEFAKSQISVSISTHDGTPNSLLEAMALGCLPICGDIESIREWITPAENGLLVDPSNPAALAESILNSLENPLFRDQAAQKNIVLVRERANLENVRIKVAAFYDRS
ncbi:MAG: putative glycosyltransferase [Chloroflexi bacterium]|nr:MAG: putative glycosyltransferase [Chloroflexota bacterium]